MTIRFTTLASAMLVVGAAACASGTQASGSAASANAAAAADPVGTVIVANMGDNTATLIDVASKRVVATLPTGNGAHEVAVSHDGRWAVVSNYGVRGAPGNTLTVIDVPAAAVTRTIDLGEFRRPHSSAFLPGDSQFVVTSEMAKAIVLVDFKAGTVIGSIPTNHPASHMLAVTADARRIYTANIADGTVSEIDGPGRKFVREYTVAPQVEGIAVSPGGEQVWVGSNKSNTVTILDPKAGAIAGTIAGFGMAYRLAVTPDNRTVVITDPPNAVVRIIDRVTRKDRATVKIPAEGVTDKAEFPGSPSPEGIILSRDGRTAFVALQGNSRVAIIDIGTGSILGYVPTGAGPDGIGYSPFGR
jgi:DNA-binding beta-propeller fold protein YncE